MYVDELELLLTRLPGVSGALSSESEVDIQLGTAHHRFSVYERSAPAPGQITTWAQTRQGEEPVLVIADRVSKAVRQEILHLGWSWWDRRGHLHLQAPGLLVDTPIDPVCRVHGVALNTGRPSASAVWLEVATTLLVDPLRGWGVRGLERELGRAASAVSKVLADLRHRALIGRDGLPLLPDLFWEVAGQWRAEFVPVAKKPPNAVLTDASAATRWGAGLLASGPPSFYVVDDRALREATRQVGSATWEGRAAAVATAPVPLAGQPIGRHKLAHPLVVALDLAQDVGRGREALEAWTPPAPYHRVW